MIAQLALGTAQFGMDYGVVNRKGQLAADEAAAVLRLAREQGVGFIDTAPAYGDAEYLLGRFGVPDFKIISKVPRIGDAEPRAAIARSGRRSVDRIGCKRLDGLLLHSVSDLFGPQGAEVYAGLLDGRDAGIYERVGVSIYDPDEVAVVLDRYPVDIVQCPLSVLDRRMGACIASLADRGIAVHLRSIFLQGILLQSPDQLPPRFAPLLPAIQDFRNRAFDCGMTALEATLTFVRDVPGVECIVVGVTGTEELLAIVKAFKTDRVFDPRGLVVPAPDMIDPRRWNAI